MNRTVRTLGTLVAVAGLIVLAAPPASATPANDNYADATDLGSGDTVSVAGEVITATVEPDNDLGGSHSVWYRWTAPFTGTVSYNTCDTDFDNVVMWFTDPGPTIPGISQITLYSDDTTGCGPAPFGGSIRSLYVNKGVPYVIRITGFGSATGNFVLAFHAGEDLTPPPVAQAIGKSGACDTANGWAESWQDWVNGGKGGAVCERTLVYWNGWGSWIVARFDSTEGRYVPVWGATAFPGGGSTETPGVKSSS